MQQAQFWEHTREPQQVRCGLCRFACLIADQQQGRCRVRENHGGVLYSANYGRLIACNADPIEKKPLFHCLPGSRSLSVATVGCNFHCRHCQNSQISQWPAEKAIVGENITPQQVVAKAQNSGCASIAYTYTEPTIFWEYMLDCARQATEAGIANVLVTNGYTSAKALEAAAPWLTAANVDLKAFDDKVYPWLTGGAHLKGVLACLRQYRQLGIWLEITTLVIPGVNDDEQQLQGIARFIRDELGPETPWHVTGFYPAYLMQDRLPTPEATLQRAHQIGKETGLYYVYSGNRPGAGGEDTCCQQCSRVLLERYGFSLLANHLQQGTCPYCGTPLAGPITNASIKKTGE